MDLPNDPFILLGVVNMKLRDSGMSLSELCDDLGVSEAEIIGPLRDAGFEYVPEINQFR